MWKLLVLACMGVALAAQDGPCTQKNAALRKMMEDARAKGNEIMDLPSYRCEDDGSYARVQCMGSEGYCYCAAKDGKTIGKYSNNFNDGWKDMTCNCARDSYEYQQTGLVGKMFACDRNGNYRRIQCLGSVCFCADKEGNNASDGGGVNIGHIATLDCHYLD